MAKKSAVEREIEEIDKALVGRRFPTREAPGLRAQETAKRAKERKAVAQAAPRLVQKTYETPYSPRVGKDLSGLAQEYLDAKAARQKVVRRAFFLSLAGVPHSQLPDPDALPGVSRQDQLNLQKSALQSAQSWQKAQQDWARNKHISEMDRMGVALDLLQTRLEMAGIDDSRIKGTQKRIKAAQKNQKAAQKGFDRINNAVLSEGQNKQAQTLGSHLSAYQASDRGSGKDPEIAELLVNAWVAGDGGAMHIKEDKRAKFISQAAEQMGVDVTTAYVLLEEALRGTLNPEDRKLGLARLKEANVLHAGSAAAADEADAAVAQAKADANRAMQIAPKDTFDEDFRNAYSAFQEGDDEQLAGLLGQEGGFLQAMGDTRKEGEEPGAKGGRYAEDLADEVMKLAQQGEREHPLYIETKNSLVGSPEFTAFKEKWGYTNDDFAMKKLLEQYKLQKKETLDRDKNLEAALILSGEQPSTQREYIRAALRSSVSPSFRKAAEASLEKDAEAQGLTRSTLDKYSAWELPYEVSDDPRESEEMRIQAIELAEKYDISPDEGLRALERAREELVFHGQKWDEKEGRRLAEIQELEPGETRTADEIYEEEKTLFEKKAKGDFTEKHKLDWTESEIPDHEYKFQDEEGRTWLGHGDGTYTLWKSKDEAILNEKVEAPKPGEAGDLYQAATGADPAQKREAQEKAARERRAAAPAEEEISWESEYSVDDPAEEEVVEEGVEEVSRSPSQAGEAMGEDLRPPGKEERKEGEEDFLQMASTLRGEMSSSGDFPTLGEEELASSYGQISDYLYALTGQRTQKRQLEALQQHPDLFMKDLEADQQAAIMNLLATITGEKDKGLIAKAGEVAMGVGGAVKKFADPYLKDIGEDNEANIEKLTSKGFPKAQGDELLSAYRGGKEALGGSSDPEAVEKWAYAYENYLSWLASPKGAGPRAHKRMIRKSYEKLKEVGSGLGLDPKWLENLAPPETKPLPRPSGEIPDDEADVTPVSDAAVGEESTGAALIPGLSGADTKIAPEEKGLASLEAKEATQVLSEEEQLEKERLKTEELLKRQMTGEAPTTMVT